MMDWTDRHCRYFHRLISPHAVLYTEMVTTGALIHGDAERFLRFDAAELPVVLQLGGSDPEALARCAAMGQDAGYSEINLNCGCPSDRVQNGRFGACLMGEADHVALCMEAMIGAVDIPVTIKCRIGIDAQDSFEFLDSFVAASVDKGVEHFVIHARKAWLSGLSPKENREIPPLDYDRVAAIKAKYPHIKVTLNGGIASVEQIRELTGRFDGFMIGREAYSNPYFLAEIEREIFGNEDLLARDEIVRLMVNYAQVQYQQYGTPIKSITRHMLGLYHEQSGARKWKRYLSENAHLEASDAEVLLRAMDAIAA